MEFGEVYHRAVREPLMAAVSLLPGDWPRPPEWAYDLLVVWSFSLTALRMFLTFEGEKALLQKRAMRR